MWIWHKLHISSLGGRTKVLERYELMYIYTSGGHYPMLAQVVYIAYTPLLLHMHPQDKPVIHTLEPENPTFLMTVPAEKPSLNLHHFAKKMSHIHHFANYGVD